MGKHSMCLSVCVPISHLLLDIIRTNCPIFDADLFLWWRFPTGVSEATTRRKKQHEDELEKLFTKNSLLMSLQELLSSTGLVNRLLLLMPRQYE